MVGYSIALAIPQNNGLLMMAMSDDDSDGATVSVWFLYKGSVNGDSTGFIQLSISAHLPEKRLSSSGGAIASIVEKN